MGTSHRKKPSTCGHPGIKYTGCQEEKRCINRGETGFIFRFFSALRHIPPPDILLIETKSTFFAKKTGEPGR
jgi:hypothetical protein